MYVVCVSIGVKPEHIDEFRTATLANAGATRTEAGNVRFDVLQGEEDGTKWFFYEVYRTKDDFRSHQQTPHYLLWRDTVGPWMAEPRKGERFMSVYPEGEWPR